MLTFVNTETQDVVLECIQYPARLFPTGCKNENTPQNYVYTLKNSNLSSMATSPSQASCDGGAINMPNLAPGTYNIIVFSFGSDVGHSEIWKMRSFGDKSKVALNYRTSPYS